jgi:hypothetical protein
MPPLGVAIRAKRKLTNRLIARRKTPGGCGRIWPTTWC